MALELKTHGDRSLNHLAMGGRAAAASGGARGYCEVPTLARAQRHTGKGLERCRPGKSKPAAAAATAAEESRCRRVPKRWGMHDAKRRKAKKKRKKKD
jgi:hypothetical protein